MISYFLVWYHIWYYEAVWYHRRFSLSCQKISDIIYDIIYNIKRYWHISYEIVENIRNFWYHWQCTWIFACFSMICVWYTRTSNILAIWYHIFLMLSWHPVRFSSWNLKFQAGTWNFKVKGSGSDVPSWVTICTSLDSTIYVQAGTSGCSSGSQVPFSRVSHSRQAAGWVPVTVSRSQHLKYKSVRLVGKGQY